MSKNGEKHADANTSVESTPYWIFDQDQLLDALRAWHVDAPNQAAADAMRRQVGDFLHSDACIERGMCRGGETERR